MYGMKVMSEIFWHGFLLVICTGTCKEGTVAALLRMLRFGRS